MFVAYQGFTSSAGGAVEPLQADAQNWLEFRDGNPLAIKICGTFYTICINMLLIFVWNLEVCSLQHFFGNLKHCEMVIPWYCSSHPFSALKMCFNNDCWGGSMASSDPSSSMGSFFAGLKRRCRIDSCFTGAFQWALTGVKILHVWSMAIWRFLYMNFISFHFNKLAPHVAMLHQIIR